MSHSSNINSGRIGFAGLLTLIFVVAKLFGVIAWSWVWVLSPIWISIILVLVIIGLALLAAKLAG